MAENLRYEVRDLTDDDFEALGDLHAAAFPDDGRFLFDEPAVATRWFRAVMREAPDGFVVGAFSDTGELLGFNVLYPADQAAEPWLNLRDRIALLPVMARRPRRVLGVAWWRLRHLFERESPSLSPAAAADPSKGRELVGESLAVSDAARGLGVGRALIEAGISRGTELGFSAILGHAPVDNQSSMDFFAAQQYGFVEAGGSTFVRRSLQPDDDPD